MNFYADFNWLAGIVGVGIFLILLFFLPIIIISIVADWKIFKKAGKNGWESLIPIYNQWVLIEISGLNWWWFLLLVIDIAFEIKIDGLTMAISICGFLSKFNCYYNIARRFGKDKTTSIFVGLFSFIFKLIFAFSKNHVYDMNIPVSVNGIFGNVDSSVGNKNESNYYNDSDRYDDTEQQGNDENTNQSTTVVDKDVKDKNINNNREYSYCGNCGLKLDKNVKFCPNCGREKR